MHVAGTLHSTHRGGHESYYGHSSQHQHHKYDVPDRVVYNDFDITGARFRRGSQRTPPRTRRVTCPE